MKASLRHTFPFLLIAILTRSAVAEYPFDYGVDSGYAPPAPVYDDGYGGYDDGYGAESYLFDDAYPPVDDLFTNEIPIWPGWISGTYQPGTDRQLGYGEWFQPLYQDGQSLWYFDFRGQGDDDGASEFNIGTGLRIMLDPGWIFGVYGFWDILNSRYDNTFHQGTIGIEAMSVLWDGRFNVYFPESDAKFTNQTSAGVSNGNLVVRRGVERAYWGMDFEVGNLLWAWGPSAQHELRGFVGAYRFDHSAPGYRSISGPRGRLEWRWYDLFGVGSRLTFGLTAQHDRVRDGQLFGFLQLRLPLDPWAHGRRRLSPLHRRMLDPVVRDIDIVSNNVTRSEAAINPVTGRRVGGVRTIDAESKYVGDILSELSEDAVIVIDGSKGDVVLPRSFVLKPGQMVFGGGSSMRVRGSSSGSNAMWHATGTRPIVEFDGDAIHQIDWTAPPEGGWVHTMEMKPDPIGFQMADRTELNGVDIVGGGGRVVSHELSSNSRYVTGGSVYVRDAKAVTIRDVGIRQVGTAGIEVNNSRNVTIDNVRIENYSDRSNVFVVDNNSAGNDIVMTGLYNPVQFPADESPGGAGIYVKDSRDVHITGAKIDDLSQGIKVVRASNVTVEQSSIRDTALDGIRLVDTENVTISDVDLKDVTEQWFVDTSLPGFVYLPEYPPIRTLGGITLENTTGTTIRDTRIDGTVGVGLVGDDARSTLIERITMTDVTRGLQMTGGEDFELVDSKIQVRDPREITTQSGSLLVNSENLTVRVEAAGLTVDATSPIGPPASSAGDASGEEAGAFELPIQKDEAVLELLDADVGQPVTLSGTGPTMTADDTTAIGPPASQLVTDEDVGQPVIMTADDTTAIGPPASQLVTDADVGQPVTLSGSGSTMTSDDTTAIGPPASSTGGEAGTAPLTDSEVLTVTVRSPIVRGVGVGVALYDMQGDVTIRDSFMDGLTVSNFSGGATNLLLTDNIIADSEGSHSFSLSSTYNNHDLTAIIEHNEFRGNSSNVSLYLVGNGDADVLFANNQVRGAFDVSSRGENRNTVLKVLDNSIEGTGRTGLISARGGSGLSLEYERNRSAAGADVMMIDGTDGQISMPDPSGNEHTPRFKNVARWIE